DRRRGGAQGTRERPPTIARTRRDPWGRRPMTKGPTEYSAAELRDRALMSGRSVTQLAQDLGITRQAMSRILHGHTTPSMATAARMMKHKAFRGLPLAFFASAQRRRTEGDDDTSA
ncbi:MAG: helix-turn-helix transcriptional regulator, partial [Patescibacteria group bacterium]|nr:helix-turn-helix transcriptional regulator [Patescibacteria group bacterium]